jgi:hypothetical protein
MKVRPCPTTTLWSCTAGGSRIIEGRGDDDDNGVAVVVERTDQL